jgi:tRNA dimethylallyltransferase
MKQKVLFVVGPTASGKTDAAVELALRLNGEVISADSMAIYDKMDIGTAKPTLEEQRGVVHHMIGCVDPQRPYSVSEYKDDALKCMESIWAKGKLPIVCGGTGLYINALIFPLDFTSVKSDEKIRAKWESYAAEHGNEALHARLREVDPSSAEQIHPNNVRRVVRALEIYECTGIAKSEQASLEKPFELPYEPVLMGITLDRKLLYERCDLRVDRMMERGLMEEVKSLLQGGLSPDAQSMQGIGYKEIVWALRGDMPLCEALELLKRNTRHLAKRQLTWFRANDKIRWFDATSAEDRAKLCDQMERYSLGNF